MNRLWRWQSLILVFAIAFTSVFGSALLAGETVYAAEEATEEECIEAEDADSELTAEDADSELTAEDADSELEAEDADSELEVVSVIESDTEEPVETETEEPVETETEEPVETETEEPAGTETEEPAETEAEELTEKGNMLMSASMILTASADGEPEENDVLDSGESDTRDPEEGDSQEPESESESEQLVNLAACTITLSQSGYTYSGSACTPGTTVTLVVNGQTITLVKDTDYTVSYSNNTNVGTATVTITGKGNYTSSASKQFTISAMSLSSASVTLSSSSYTYSGSACAPGVTVTVSGRTLTKDTDYTVSYSSNINAGTATATVTGKGNYTGNTSKTFTISAKSISGATVSLSKTSYTYNGTARKPTPTVSLTVNGSSVTLTKDTNYTVSYSNNTNAGTATVTITGKGNYTGSVSKTFTIKKKSLSSAKVTLSKTSYTYNGSAKKPGTTVKLTVNGSTVTLKKNTDYTVTYSNNKKIGTATVTIKGKGNYSGSVKVTFKIVPAKVTLKSVSVSGKALKITWKKVKGATGYAVYRKTSGGTWKKIKTIKSGSTLSYSDSSAKAGTKYYYRVRAYYKKSGSKAIWGSYSKSKSKTCKPAAVTLKSITLASGTSAKITWKSQSTADGYYIYRKSGDSWKKIATVTSGTSYTDTGLKYGKTYKYTVKAYWNSGSSTIKGYYDTTGLKIKVKYTSKYVDGYKLYYDAKGNLITDVTDIIGEQSSYEIKVNKQCNTVTVYAKDGDNGYIIPVKAFVCSCGNATPLGTFYTPEKYRWHTLQHGVEGQWCTRITTGILFHSVWYYSRDNTTLTTVQYNKLGTTASAGCVRLTAEDAKWIYDNCSLGTKVTIYNSSDPGPLGKPTALTLESWHTWDPTDPTAQYLCEKYGCH